MTINSKSLFAPMEFTGVRGGNVRRCVTVEKREEHVTSKGGCFHVAGESMISHACVPGFKIRFEKKKGMVDGDGKCFGKSNTVPIHPSRLVKDTFLPVETFWY